MGKLKIKLSEIAVITDYIPMRSKIKNIKNKIFNNKQNSLLGQIEQKINQILIAQIFYFLIDFCKN